MFQKKKTHKKKVQAKRRRDVHLHETNRRVRTKASKKEIRLALRVNGARVLLLRLGGKVSDCYDVALARYRKYLAPNE